LKESDIKTCDNNLPSKECRCFDRDSFADIFDSDNKLKTDSDGKTDWLCANHAEKLMSVLQCYTRRHNFREEWVLVFENDLTQWWNNDIDSEERDIFEVEMTDFVGGSKISSWGTYFTSIREYIKKAARALLITCPQRILRGNNFTRQMSKGCNLAQKVVDFFFSKQTYTVDFEPNHDVNVQQEMTMLQWSLAAEYVHRDLYDLANWENQQHQAAVEQIEKCYNADILDINNSSDEENAHWTNWINMICHRHFLNDTNGGASVYCQWFPLAAKKCQQVVDENICGETESQDRRRNLKLLKGDQN